jgi:uncharacterized protein YqjF (DUF2071 family)
MHPSLLELDHRPWPIPSRPWIFRQSWRDLAFLHWPIAAEKLRPLVPPSLAIEEFEGSSWIGVVPFRMTGVMLRPLPDLPWVSAFPELNVRVYVERDGKPGVWFLSLDAANPVAVWGARRFFHLPYHLAGMSLVEHAGAIRYRSRRAGAEFVARYRPTSDVYRAARGTLEHWLTERYCLYALAPDGSLWRNDVHHPQWPLQSASVEIVENSMLAPHGLEVEGPPALVHFARRLDVIVWDAERVA